MTDREQALQLLNAVPDYKLGYVLAYLQGVCAGEDVPNEKILAAFKEYDKTIANKSNLSK